MKNIVIVLLILFVFKLKAQQLEVIGNKVDTVCMQSGSSNLGNESLNPVWFIANATGGQKPFLYIWKHNLDIQDWITNPSDSILLVNGSFYTGLKNARIVCIVTDAKNNVDSVVWTPAVSNSLADYVFPYKRYSQNIDIRTKRAKLNFEVPSYSITSISGFFNDTIDLVEKGIGWYPYQIRYKKAGCDLAAHGFLTIYSMDSIISSQIQTTEKEVFVYLPEKKRIQLWVMQDSIRFDNYPSDLYSDKNVLINNCYNYIGFSNCDTATAAYTLEKSNNARWLILNPQKRGNYKLNFYSIDRGGRIVPFQLKLHVLDTLFEAQGSVRTQEAYLKSGKVQAFRKGNNQTSIVQTVDIKSDGTFLFENLAEGNYYFLAVPDDSLLSPTYYVDNEMAQNAYLLDLYGNTESIDILVEKKVELGKNSIQGNIAQSIGNESISTAMKPIDDEYIESYQLVDVSGKVVASGTVLPDFGEYSGLQAGVYILMLKTNKGVNRRKIGFY